jgi:hypothetical protein
VLLRKFMNAAESMGGDALPPTPCLWRHGRPRPCNSSCLKNYLRRQQHALFQVPRHVGIGSRVGVMSDHHDRLVEVLV